MGIFKTSITVSVWTFCIIKSHYQCEYYIDYATLSVWVFYQLNYTICMSTFVSNYTIYASIYQFYHTICVRFSSILPLYLREYYFSCTTPFGVHTFKHMSSWVFQLFGIQAIRFVLSKMGHLPYFGCQARRTWMKSANTNQLYGRGLCHGQYRFDVGR